MQVKNYIKGNYIDAFNCVIYGEIKMTWSEWWTLQHYLYRAGGNMFEKKMLREDMRRPDKYLEDGKGTTYRNIRVTYTKKVFDHYKLPRYKRQNYILKITNKK
ncbi:MAG: hypothetical protein V4509_04595 [Patescibacteria group bacterium]